ncbi:hypothetical protein [Soonwooa sp.]|uniref:hypothetical protein n=1 Tax=Soonwooa sp. TaxID=1938592 RepID=UPI00289F2B54|nr:hypothetical protein [Soonwooa sp.]
MSKEEIIITTLNHLLEEVTELKEQLGLNKDTFNVKDFSAYSGIKESFIYKIVGQQLISYSKPNGKMLFFSKSDVDDYLRQNPVKAKSEISKDAIEFSLRKK